MPSALRSTADIARKAYVVVLVDTNVSWTELVEVVFWLPLESGMQALTTLLLPRRQCSSEVPKFVIHVDCRGKGLENTITTLNVDNSKLQGTIVELQGAIVEVRDENSTLQIQVVELQGNLHILDSAFYPS